MKNSIFSVMLTAMFMLMGWSAFAQPAQGTLKLEIIEATSDNPQMAAGLEMMKGTITEVVYQNGQSVTKMNMMGGMVEIDVKMSKDGNMDMLMNAMGNKMWIQASKTELNLAKAENDSPLADLDFDYDEDDRKEIAGFDCFKMIATAPGNEDFKLEAYITEDIKINAAVMQGIDITDFRGFPLEYIFDAGMMKMTVSTTEYSDEVVDGAFELDTNGYTKMSYDEFLNSMGQMGGGIGF